MTPGDFLQTIDNQMAMKNGDWLEEQLANSEDLVLLDLRGMVAWDKEHIDGSISVSIQELPDRATAIIPDNNSTIVCICNGSIQSAMATMYLRTQDYVNSYNLSGGFSGWIRNNRPTV